MAHLVDSRHPSYQAWLPFWQLARRSYEGEEEIKAQGEVYLQMPGGFRLAPDPKAEYAAYIERAVYPEILAPTIRGMAGVMHSKPATYELPDSLAYLLEDASRDNLTLEALHRRITREILEVGRYGLLADIDENGEGYIAGYKAEAILNWDTGPDGRLSMVLLEETAPERDPVTYEWKDVEAWRLLELDDAGFYIVRRFRKEDGRVVEIEPVEPLLRGGGRLDFIPFTFVDTNDLTPEPDEIPLLPLAKVAVSIYRLEADYRRALYLTSCPTMVLIGDLGDDEGSAPIPVAIGSAVPIVIPPPGDAKFLEFTGAGVAAQRQAILDEMERAVQLGARLLSDQTGRQESGEARRLRYANESATLTSISQNVGAGLESVLRHLALWLGINEELVTVEPNEQFAETNLTPQETDALVRSWQAGAISHETLFENLQKGGVVNEAKAFEEEQEAIERDGGGLGLIGREVDALSE